jgi:plastocyanin
MPSRSFAPLLALIAVMFAVSPVRAEDSVPGSPDVTITLRDGVSDKDVRVPRGGIVRFVNRDDERHRMRSGSGEGFDTGNLEPGESFQVRLPTEGTFTYIDEREDDDARYHGRIRVVADGTKPASDGTARITAATITIVDEAFDPGTTTVEVGGTVKFQNADGDEHTATSAGAGGIDSGVLATGATYQKTFTESGSFAFWCIIHPEMRGTIEVVGGSASAAPAATPTPPPGPSSETASVDIVDLAFEPTTVELTAGESVTWTNTGAAPHTVTAEDGSFDSKTLKTGAAFTETFDTPGSFAYLCQIHPDMRGTVRVVEGQQPAAAAPAQLAATPAAAVDSPLHAGTVAAVALVSIAVVLFARVLASTPRRAEQR